MIDGDDWYKLYREVGGDCGAPIDPYYEHQANLIIDDMRRRERPKPDVLTDDEFRRLSRKSWRGESLTDAERAAMERTEDHARNH